jgi:hypothetical protein
VERFFKFGGDRCIASFKRSKGVERDPSSGTQMEGGGRANFADSASATAFNVEVHRKAPAITCVSVYRRRF